MDGLEWGPPYYPKCSGCDPGFRFSLEQGMGLGGLAVYHFWCPTVGQRGITRRQATHWQSQVSETNCFHCAAPQYPPSELECLLAISCCQPPDPHPRHPSAFCPTLQPCANVLESPRDHYYPPFFVFKKSRAVVQCCKKQKWI